MSERLPMRVLWVAAAAALVCGAVLTLKSIRDLRTAGAKLQLALSHLDQLETHETEFNRSLAARQVFEELPSGQPVPLAGLLAQALPGAAADDVRESYRGIGPGWGVRRQELSFTEVPLAGIMTFLYDAESRRPPWRARKCEIRASSGNGSGKVVLALEALERTE
jgi:hypothetical protein